jgi:pimeloyl-ACP methyl ester carboxylesterase
MNQSPAQLADLALERARGHKVQLETGITHYWTYSADKPSRRTIVMVHGYRGNHHGLEALAGALTDFNVVIPDLPGFGQSEELHGTYTVDAYAHWLVLFVATLKTEGIVVLGHSFGSIVTAAAAANELDNDLILVNPVSRFENQPEQWFLNLLVNAYYGLGNNLPKPMANGLLRNPIFVRIMSEVLAKTPEPALRKWIHRQHDQNFSDFADRRVAVEGYQASISKSVVSYSSGLKNKVLLIAGEQDDITSLPDQQRAASLFTNAQLKVIASVGHLIHYEAPEQAAMLIRAFLNESSQHA